MRVVLGRVGAEVHRADRHAGRVVAGLLAEFRGYFAEDFPEQRCSLGLHVSPAHATSHV